MHLLSAGLSDALIVDRAKIGLSEHAEREFLPACRGVERHGNGYQSKTDSALPQWSHKSSIAPKGSNRKGSGCQPAALRRERRPPLRPQGFAWQRASRPGDLFVHLPRAALFFFFSPGSLKPDDLAGWDRPPIGFSATRGFFPAAAGGRVARFVEPSGASRP
jgi:hypothetical protein